MINIFQLPYLERFQVWFDFRKTIEPLDLKQKCVETDKWWQHTPLVNHHLHLYDIESWPGPWELLAENIYCNIARGLGMCYTLKFCDIKDIKMVEAKNDQGEEIVLVLVDDGKYVMNYWPDSVLSTNLKDFKITKKVNLETVFNKHFK